MLDLVAGDLVGYLLEFVELLDVLELYLFLLKLAHLPLLVLLQLLRQELVYPGFVFLLLSHQFLELLLLDDLELQQFGLFSVDFLVLLEDEVPVDLGQLVLPVYLQLGLHQFSRLLLPCLSLLQSFAEHGLKLKDFLHLPVVVLLVLLLLLLQFDLAAMLVILVLLLVS